MKTLRRTTAVVALGLILAVSAFAGIIHSPGKESPPPPPPPIEESSTSTNSITTDVILTLLSLIS